MCNTFESGVNELPKQRQKWSPKDNRKLWETYVESESERRGYMERMRKLWLQKTGKDEKAQRLRTQVRNIQKKNLLTDVERGEIEQRAKLRRQVSMENEEIV